jgi:regulator-associated protein of mTOR
MWEVWDLAADQCLSQLPHILDKNSNVEYKLSNFFADQLSAFEVWIKKGGSRTEPPLQLPIVLQVLLSQVHRLRALHLLSKFLDFGQWAVSLALSVGIFPYVLKLLQSPALELRPVLVFIWAKLLAVDATCRDDLLKDNGYTYFLGILTNTSNTAMLVPNISEHRAMCVFILSVFCKNFLPGQQACLANDLLPALLPMLQDQDSLLRQWTCVCLANFWSDFPDAKWAAFNIGAHDQLIQLLEDPVPEVRAAAVNALGNLFGGLDRIDQVTQMEHAIIVSILKTIQDASPMVRKELACAFSNLVQEDENKFLYTAFEVLEEERRAANLGPSNDSESLSADSRRSAPQQSIYLLVWRSILTLSVDPFPSVAAVASHITDTVYLRLMNSNLVDGGLNQFIETKRSTFKPVPMHPVSEGINVAKKIGRRSTASVSSGIFGMSLEADRAQSIKRSSSFVFSLKSIGNLVGINNGSQTNLSETASPRSSSTIRTPQPRRRPQSMYMSSLNETSSLSKLRPSPSDIQIATKPDPELRLAVKSTFFDWSCEYFREPQMKIPEIDEPGSVKHCERQWRLDRNQKVNQEVLSMYRHAGSTRFESILGSISHDLDPQFVDKCMVFHPYDPYIVVADATNINVLDWETQKSLHCISNLNPPSSHITALKFINDEDASILMAGSGRRLF